MTKEEQVDSLVGFIVDAMDIDALEDYVRWHLKEYYLSTEGQEDFDTNYAEMQGITGEENVK